MRLQRAFNALTVVLALLWSPLLAAGEQPALSGRVLAHADGGHQPLDQVKVELLAADSDQVVAHCYTDSQGHYAFHRVQPGAYRLRLKFGEQVLAQVFDDTTATIRRITIPSQPALLEVSVRLGK